MPRRTARLQSPQITGARGSSRGGTVELFRRKICVNIECTSAALHDSRSNSFGRLKRREIRTPISASHGEETMRAVVYLIALALPVIFSAGCVNTQSVRYVYQDKDFGVIGMPENTDRWPTHYHRTAEAMMHRHFPEGYEIVRAEEVTEGSRTLKIEGSKTAEISPQLPTQSLKIAKLGRTATQTQSDVVKIKECRIIYRRTSPAEENRFSSDADGSPTQYLDPNELERKKPEAKHHDAPVVNADKANVG
jgi:hypothetical protein